MQEIKAQRKESNKDVIPTGIIDKGVLSKGIIHLYLLHMRIIKTTISLICMLESFGYFKDNFMFLFCIKFPYSIPVMRRYSN